MAGDDNHRGHFFRDLQEFCYSPLGMSLIFIAATTSGWNWYSYTGPYRWLAELQLQLFGGYEVVLTWIAVFLVTAYAMLFGIYATLCAAGMKPRVIDPAKEPERWLARQLRTRAVSSLVIACALLCIGMLFIAHERRASTLVHVTAAELEAGVVPHSTWLDVAGQGLADAAMSVSEGNMDFTYLPIVSDSWNPSVPIAAFVRLRGANVRLKGGLHYAGLTSLSGVPGFVRAGYEEAQLTLSENAIVVEPGAQPGSRIVIAVGIAGAGFLGVLVFGIRLLIVFRKTNVACPNITT